MIPMIWQTTEEQDGASGDEIAATCKNMEESKYSRQSAEIAWILLHTYVRTL
jgi:hypothetical protein